MVDVSTPQVLTGRAAVLALVKREGPISADALAGRQMLHAARACWDRALALGESLPDQVVAVAESGIRSRDDVARLGEPGYAAVLVGELLVRSRDRVGAVRALSTPAGEVRA